MTACWRSVHCQWAEIRRHDEEQRLWRFGCRTFLLECDPRRLIGASGLDAVDDQADRRRARRIALSRVDDQRQHSAVAWRRSRHVATDPARTRDVGQFPLPAAR